MQISTLNWQLDWKQSNLVDYLLMLVDHTVTRLPLKQKVRGSNLGLVKLDTVLPVGYTLGSWRSPIPVHRKESKRAAYWSCCLLHTAVSENKRKRFKRSIAITSKPCKNIGAKTM